MLLRLRGRRLRSALPRRRRRLLGVLRLPAPLLLLLGRAVGARLLRRVATGLVGIHRLLLWGIALLGGRRRGRAIAMRLRPGQGHRQGQGWVGGRGASARDGGKAGVMG